MSNHHCLTLPYTAPRAARQVRPKQQALHANPASRLRHVMMACKAGLVVCVLGSLVALGGCSGVGQPVQSTPPPDSQPTATPAPTLGTPLVTAITDFRDPKTGVDIKLSDFHGVVTGRYVNNFLAGWYLLAFYVTIVGHGSDSRDYNVYDLACTDQSGIVHGTDVVLPVPYDQTAFGNGIVYPGKPVGGWAGCMYHPHQTLQITWDDNNTIAPKTIVSLKA
jgi:hypothetical protein